MFSGRTNARTPTGWSDGSWVDDRIVRNGGLDRRLNLPEHLHNVVKGQQHMATTYRIDSFFRGARRDQDAALASLDRVHQGKQATSRQSTVEVLRRVEDTAKASNWIEKAGY
jgi:hypothetical protein